MTKSNDKEAQDIASEVTKVMALNREETAKDIERLNQTNLENIREYNKNNFVNPFRCNCSYKYNWLLIFPSDEPLTVMGKVYRLLILAILIYGFLSWIKI